MSTDLTVILADRPGTLAEMGETLGKAGVNIDGVCGFPCAGEGVIHILVQDGAAARRALESAGMQVRDERQVLLARVEDRPGELGRMTRRIAAEGVNINLLYTTVDGHVVVGARELEKARAAIADLAEPVR